VEYGTGIVVSTAGHILTDRQLTEGCNVIVVSGHGDADRQAEDTAADLALLRIYGAPDLVPATFGEAFKGSDLTLLGIADPQSQGGGRAISAMAAKARGETVEPAPQLGFSGGAALDGQGRLVGMVELRTTAVANAGAASPQPLATLVPAPAIRTFLAAQRLTPAAAGRLGADAARASLVRVICVRK
jgi:S1-C subfamily serine protease